MAENDNPFGPWLSIQVPRILAADVRKLCEAAMAYDFDLSRSDIRIVERLTEDVTARDLAKDLNVDEDYLHERISHILQKLGAKRRPGLIRVAAMYGLIGQSSDQ